MIIQRIDNASNFRFYEGKDEENQVLWTYPSVTSIISEAFPTGYYLQKYIRDNGDHGRIEFEKAADRGTNVHVAINELILGEKLPSIDFDEFEKKCIQSFLDWHAEFKPKIIASEQIVFNNELGYAGALDLVCELDYAKGKTEYKGTYVVDFKTSSAIYDNHKLQVSAYGHCLGGKHKISTLHLGNRTKAGYSFAEHDDEKYWAWFKNIKESFDFLHPNCVPSVKHYPEIFKLK